MISFDQFVHSWLIGFLFCLGLTLGSLALLMLQHLSGGQWGLVSRRIFEAGTRNLPLVALFFVPILFWLPTIFEWARPEAAENVIIQAKAAYLNPQFFIIRAVIYFAFWMLCIYLLNKWSAEQDRGIGTTPADSVRYRKVSAPGLAVPGADGHLRVGRLDHVARPRVVLDDLRPADDRRLGPDDVRDDDGGAGHARARPARSRTCSSRGTSTISASCCSRSRCCGPT